MRNWYKNALKIAGGFLIAASATLVMGARSQAVKVVHHPPEARRPLALTPAGCGLAFEEVTATTADGLRLVGWYLPSQNEAAILAAHGFRGDRADLLPAAEILHRHGYGVLIGSFRAHDRSDGELITMGKTHLSDFETWYGYLLTRGDVDPGRIGLLGQSLGGALAIHYAAQNQSIKALALDSVMDQFDDALAAGIRHYTGLPGVPLAPLVRFWAERETGVDTAQIVPTVWIRSISPRPVLIMHGGADDRIPVNSGQNLYQAAGEPKELWYEPAATHLAFHQESFRAEFERRLVGFFDRYLPDRADD